MLKKGNLYEHLPDNVDTYCLKSIDVAFIGTINAILLKTFCRYEIHTTVEKWCSISQKIEKQHTKKEPVAISDLLSHSVLFI